MTKTAPLPYAQKEFINRRKELDDFSNLITSASNPDADWILMVEGEGGIGKTSLLNEYVRTTKERSNSLVTNQFIDFQWVNSAFTVNILHSIAIQLHSPELEDFVRKYEKYQNDPDADELLIDSFVKCFGEFPEDQLIVILFDTSEKISDSVRRDISKILDDLHEQHPKTIVVFAGRPGFSNTLNLKRSRLLHLEPFTEENVREFFAEYGEHLETEIVTKAYTLSLGTSGKNGEGQLVLLGLMVDWIQKAGGIPSQLVDYADPSKFEHAMVAPIMDLEFPDDDCIMAMCHLYRRFDEEIMRFVLGIDLEKAKLLFDRLKKYTFVKYSESDEERSCVLHDQMKILIDKYLWKTYDDGRKQRNNWSDRIIEYYDQKLQDPKLKRREAHVLSIEKLAYLCDYKPAKAYEFWNQLTREYNDQYPDVRRRINEFLGNIKDKLTKQQSWYLRSRETTILAQTGEIRKAIELRESLLSELTDIEGTDALLIIASQKSKLVGLYAEDNSSKTLSETEAFARSTAEWFESIASEMENSSTQDREDLQRYIGGFYSNYGYLNRKLGNNALARKFYQRAISEAGKAKKRGESIVAEARNNAAYVEHLYGNDFEAIRECELSIQMKLRRERSALGYSYNVMGIIRSGQLRDHQAREWFARARAIFEEYRNPRGNAFVNLAEGRLLRQQGWCIYRDPERAYTCDEYKQAEQLLKQAEVSLRDDHQYYAEVLNDLGTLYRFQGEYKKSVEYYEKSLEISKNNSLKYWEADNYQDLAVSSLLQNEIDQAESHAKHALNIAQTMHPQSPQTVSRAYRTLADVAKRSTNNLEHIVNLSIQSFVNLFVPDWHSPNDSLAKKAMLYDEWLYWLKDEILNNLTKAEMQNAVDLADMELSNYMVKTDLDPTLEGLKKWLNALKDNYDLLRESIPEF
jgi:tetratricopeptide (TPR) repeat protein